MTTGIRRVFRSGRAGRPPALFVCLLAAGCAAIPPSVSDIGRSPTRIELEGTPFYPQERYQCGPAALTTILTHSGAEADLEAVTSRVYLPARRGSLQAELLAAARAAGRVPYPIDGTAAALHAELAAGRPVLVLQNLGVEWWPRWHYAVVVGLDGSEQRVILRSGTERRRVTPLGTFLRTWRRSGYWGFVALRPGELPAAPDPARWYRALAAFEEIGRFDIARRGWLAALRHWPASMPALFGLATSEFLLGNWQRAERAYRKLLERDPELAAARNNLALSLGRQGRYAEAAAEARRALATEPGDSRLRREIEKTLEELEAAAEEADQSRAGRPSSTSR